MFIIAIPEIRKTSKNSTNFQKVILQNSKPNYCLVFLSPGHKIKQYLVFMAFL